MRKKDGADDVVIVEAVRTPFGTFDGVLKTTLTLMYELMRRGGGQGVAAICGGLSQGEALLLRV